MNSFYSKWQILFYTTESAYTYICTNTLNWGSTFSKGRILYFIYP